MGLIRSIPLGIVETLGTTFGVLILVRVFEGDQWSKACIVSAPPLGLLISLFVVQLVRRSTLDVGRAMAILHLISALGFTLITLFGDSLAMYVLGILLGSIGLASAMPLMSQIYRVSYPDEKRGTLFAYGGFIRKIFAIITGIGGGWMLNQDLGNYRLLFVVFTIACVFTAFAVTKFDKVYLDQTKQTNLFSAFRHLKSDEEFRSLLFSWMFLGVGNLICMALFVEYISNRRYGYDLSELSVGMITTFVPEAVYLLVILWWGKVFDKWNFYLLRGTLNILFAVGIGIYFLGHGIQFLIIGIAIHGFAKAGGNVAWETWTVLQLDKNGFKSIFYKDFDTNSYYRLFFSTPSLSN